MMRGLWDYHGELVVMLALCGAFMALVAAVVWYGAGVEADTFNRITGGDVTQWEALWIELRVDCN